MNPSKNIFLLDSQINFSEINYSNNRDSQIITFDFDSHDALRKKSVSHLISDTFLSKKDLLDIQKNAFLLSDWYKEETLEEKICTTFNLRYISFKKRAFRYTKKCIFAI